MTEQQKPRLGVLALMLEGYEPLFPGIMERQRKYLTDVLANMKEVADFVFPRLAANRTEMENLTREYNAQQLEGIVIFLLSYAQGAYLLNALRTNHLPLALALIQPDETVREDFGELELTVNQGIHGSQDNANVLMRAGIPCSFYVGGRHDGQLKEYLRDFALAAQTRAAMQSMRIGVIGKLAGMGDVVTDDMAIFRKLGPELVYDSIGTVQRCCAAVDKMDIENHVREERKLFRMDETMPEKVHAEAVRMYLGIRAYLQQGQYSGYTAHFEEFGADARFTQLPLLAASNLMADGYAYAAEGDATCVVLMAAMMRLCQRATFSEMYMMDLAREAILFCHAGEGNWAMVRKDSKPFLMNRVFLEGGLSNPPTPIFTLEPGKAAVMSLTHVTGERFRLVYAQGEVLDKHDLRQCDMPYFFFRPQSGVRNCVTSWLNLGGTHHEAVVLGDHIQKIRLWCKMCGIDFETI